MTVRNLDYLLHPRSITLIGAEGDIGRLLIRNLLDSGFKGAVMPISRRRKAMEGVLTYRDVENLPMTPDLAVIASPLSEAPPLLQALGDRGTRGAVLIGPGNRAPQRSARKQLKQKVLAAAGSNLVRIIGPGGLGVAVPGSGLNAILSDKRPMAGNVAFVTQSGGVARSALDWAIDRGVGFSHLISLGAAIDVDFADIVDHLAGDYRARAILLHLERLRDARKFMSAARRAARIKPVLVLKPRNYTRDQNDDYVYDAAFRRAGVLRVDHLEQLFNSVETLTSAKPIDGNRLAIVCNSRSLGLLASDTLVEYGGRLAEFSERSKQTLESLIDPLGYMCNPLDLGDHAGPEAYEKAVATLMKDPGVDSVLAMNAPAALVDDVAIAEIVAKQKARSRPKLFACWVGSSAGHAGRQRLLDNSVPTYESPEEAALAFMRLVQYKRNQELLMETPPSIPEAFKADVEGARKIIENALNAGRDQLNEYETMLLLAAYEIPVVETCFAPTPEAATEISRAYLEATPKREVALKLISPDIGHKSEIRGVALDLEHPHEVLAEANAMIDRLERVDPKARLDGFVVQPMVYSNSHYELTMGIRPGGNFGPILQFGHGGTERRSIGDMAYGLPPLSMHLAMEMMSRTRIFPMLEGVRLRHADLDAIALTLIKVSQMAIDLHELTELDINPLWAEHTGIVALDATVRVEAAEPRHGRLAIRPYPKELEETLRLPDGRVFLIRPILPEDEPILRAAAKRNPPEALRLRFFQPIKELSHAMAAQLTQIDYDREMALVVTDPGIPGQADGWAVVRMTADPDMERAEYAIFIDEKVVGLGFGPMLMRRLIKYARQRGIKELYGEVLRENESMLALNKALGFKIKSVPDDPGVMHVTLVI